MSKNNSLQYNETYVETSTGRVLVAHTGGVVTNSRPVIVTYHDLGLNYVSNFQAFFNYPDFKVSSRSIFVSSNMIPRVSGNHLLVPSISH